MQIPYISRIQRFSPDDGPGIRTTIFFKGCSLQCRWCHNPECISGGPRLVLREEKCIHCGLCRLACPHGAVTESCGTDRARCASCGICAAVCPAEARTMDGSVMSPAEVVREAEKDVRFYRNGGGLTLSGGEPLLYPEFAAEVCRLANAAGIHAAIDTALSVPSGALQKVLPLHPLFLADLKAADCAVHRALTGAENGQILENLRLLAGAHARFWIRIPVIAGVNETELEAIAGIIAALPEKPERICLLPYHAMGRGKTQRYGLPEQPLFTLPSQACMTQAVALFRGLALQEG